MQAYNGKKIEYVLLLTLSFVLLFGWWRSDLMNYCGNVVGVVVASIAMIFIYMAVVGGLLARGVWKLVRYPDKYIGSFLFSLSLYVSFGIILMTIYDILKVVGAK
jgi:hypothetical protein